MKLEEYVETLAYDIAFWMAALKNPESPLGELGPLSLEVSKRLRSMAIMVLLVDANTDVFYHDLIRSGVARETYLRRVWDARALEDHHRASGRYEPLLDAIAAAEFGLARRILRLSPEEWREGHEYEDDYCYAQILRRFVEETPCENEIPQFIDRFEAFLEGKGSARLAVCRALVERDQSAFDHAFEALLDEREREIAEDKARGQLEEPEVVAQRHVFVEGLALLRLAAVRGLTTQSDYRYCPSIARAPMETPFPGE